MQYINLEETVYFFFGANNTSGSGDNGASPGFSVREAGAVASDVPTLTGTPDLLTNGGYTPGSYEVAVEATAANGFGPDKTYAVFATLAVDGQNPTGHIGIFRTQPVPSSVHVMKTDVITNTAIENAAISATKFAAGAIDAAAIANGAIDAATFAANAIDAAALAADAVAEIQVGLSTFDATTDKVDLLATGLDLIDIDGMSMRVATRAIFAGVSGDLSGAGTGIETFKGANNTTTRMVSTVDASGNRTVTYP